MLRDLLLEDTDMRKKTVIFHVTKLSPLLEKYSNSHLEPFLFLGRLRCLDDYFLSSFRSLLLYGLAY